MLYEPFVNRLYSIAVPVYAIGYAFLGCFDDLTRIVPLMAWGHFGANIAHALDEYEKELRTGQKQDLETILAKTDSWAFAWIYFGFTIGIIAISLAAPQELFLPTVPRDLAMMYGLLKFIASAQSLEIWLYNHFSQLS